MRGGLPGGCLDLVRVGVWPGVGDVGGDGVVEKKRFLGYQGDGITQR